MYIYNNTYATIWSEFDLMVYLPPSNFSYVMPLLQILDISVDANIGEEVLVNFPVFQDVKYLITSF